MVFFCAPLHLELKHDANAERWKWGFDYGYHIIHRWLNSQCKLWESPVSQASSHLSFVLNRGQQWRMASLADKTQRDTRPPRTLTRQITSKCIFKSRLTISQRAWDQNRRWSSQRAGCASQIHRLWASCSCTPPPVWEHCPHSCILGKV